MVYKNDGTRDSYGLSDEDILAFIQAWHQDFGERLTTEEARARAHELLEFMLLLARRGPMDDRKD